MLINIDHLFTSKAHNYFGHHGKPAGTSPIIEQNEIELIAGRGIVDDRFFDWKDDYKGQITFFNSAIVAQVRDFTKQPELPASTFRRNVITTGVDLNCLIGSEFTINGIRFLATEECRPCYWMDSATGCEGTEEILKGNGGLRCKILSSGSFKLDSASLQITS